MRPQRLPVCVPGSIALLCLLASPSTARAVDQWIQIGDGVHLTTPTGDRHNESGRLAQVSLAWDDDQSANVVWAGASHGGLWKADGITKITKWTTITDNFPGSHTLGSFAVRQGDSKTIVIGTGAKGWGNGNGIYYTTKGGQNWKPSQLCVLFVSCAPATAQRVNRIVADGSDSNHEKLVAATSEGIWLSFDFGQTWIAALSGVEATDVVQDTGNPKRWYAGVIGQGIYQSKDSGLSWKAPSSGSGITGSIDRISLAACAKDEHYLYAIVATSTDTLNGVYRSSDRGSTWVPIYAGDTANETIAPDGQAKHTCAIACDPRDPDHIFFGLSKAVEVTNATTADEVGVKPPPKHPNPIQATPIDGGHSDYNFLLFDSDKTHLHVANDGGYYSYDYSNNCSQKALTNSSVQCVDDSADVRGLDVLELGAPYPAAPSTLQGGLASSWSHPEQFLAGLQDDGIVRGDVSKNGGNGEITYLEGGDGRHASIMPNDPDLLGYNRNGGSVNRFLWDASKNPQEESADLNLTAEKESPVLIDPMPGIKTPYVFTAGLDDNIGDGRILSGVYFNEAKNPQSDWTLAGPAIPVIGGSVSNIDVTTNPELYEIVGVLDQDTRAFAYTGSRSQPLGPTSLSYSDITPPLPAAPATHPDARINADRSIYAPTTIYYTSGLGSPRLAFMSPDGGAHWTDVLGNIAAKSGNAALLKLVGNPANYPVTEFFLATTKGVFRSVDGGKCWFGYSEGLRKDEEIDDIILNFDNTSATGPTLYIATHGRGFWRRTVQPRLNSPVCSGSS
jgi:hypothetical protein